MANPFLVLGGIAVGVVTAAFGILQVPGWVSSAQDASAKNDISQVSILQSASLSQVGIAQTSIDPSQAVDNKGAKVDLGVDVSTGASDSQIELTRTADKKHYAVVVESESGKAFSRVDGGEIKEHADITTAKNAASQALAALDPA